MEYKDLKRLQCLLNSSNEEKITIEKSVVISLVDEILIKRRRDTAKIRQNQAKQSEPKENTMLDLKSRNCKASFHRKP